ncbi:hypothetical protein HMPREF0290_0837 [Corynebacterium efficiens YS-314]|nr:hypothetical protein HMPREF0290_0837 [Corynebacterium efficiens YS-314]
MGHQPLAHVPDATPTGPQAIGNPHHKPQPGTGTRDPGEKPGMDFLG